MLFDSPPLHRRAQRKSILKTACFTATNRDGLSIIVSDANSGARRLYERAGYQEIATRPMHKGGWENDGENWVLLIKRQ